MPSVVLFLLLSSPVDAEALAREARSVLAERCYRCHGPDVQKSRLRLDRREPVLGPEGIVVPGDPGASVLWQRVASDDPDERMPPAEDLPLSADELATLRTWIETGATWREHWSLEPVVPAEPPPVEQTEWSTNPVDRFVRKAMEERGIEPAPEVDPATWLRRASFALTGLPPTPEELADFLRTPDAGGREHVVARLLASPHHAEHRARQWLDLVRYAETRGHEFDLPIPGAFEYRDWVVRACAADLRYDLFVTEQLAGDLLEPPRLSPQGWNESVLGTGFWFLGEEVHSPVDLAQDQADRTANKVDVLGKAFLGLTVACARCHDHKFDPILAQDFYSYAGIAQSGSYREVRFETLEQERALRAELERLRAGQGTHVLAELRAHGLRKPLPEARIELPPDARVLGDWTAPDPEAPIQDGSTWIVRGRGDVHFGRSPETPILRAFELGCVSADPLWNGLDTADGLPDGGTSLNWSSSGRTLRTRGFTLGSGKLWYLVEGQGTAFVQVATHRTVHGPLHGQTIRALDSEGFAWIEHDLSAFAGLNAHVEFTPRAGGGSDPEGAPWLSLALVIESETPPGFALEPSDEGTPSALRPGSLPGEPSAPLASFYARQAELLDARVLVSRVAPAMLDGNGLDEPLYVRGNPSERSELAPRRDLAAVRTDDATFGPESSGRLALARAWTRPEHPLLARVAVNRAWQQVFGRGLSETPDNLGVLGRAPTHPELLDTLAARFVAVHGWRWKPLLAELVLSRAFRSSSTALAASAEQDPTNSLWHHVPVRRLAAEELRDALLSVSGRLDRTAGGPSVPVYLNEWMDGRGKPAASGPLDGAGRRSLYLEVRRNFLDSFLREFDFPTPFTTIGRRTSSSVPAQDLAMMNAPLVHELARFWSERLAREVPEPAARVRRAHLEAFARAPEPEELALALAFLEGFGDAWPDYLHALVQTKEFRHVR